MSQQELDHQVALSDKLSWNVVAQLQMCGLRIGRETSRYAYNELGRLQFVPDRTAEEARKTLREVCEIYDLKYSVAFEEKRIEFELNDEYTFVVKFNGEVNVDEFYTPRFVEHIDGHY